MSPVVNALEALPLSVWPNKRFQKTFDLEHDMDNFDRVKDKVRSYAQTEVFNHFDPRVLKESEKGPVYPKTCTRRLPLKVLKRDDMNLYKEVTKFMLIDHDLKNLTIALKIKERQHKLSGRAFAVNPLNLQLLQSLSECRLTRCILTMLSAQTLTLANADLDKHLLELAQRLDVSRKFVATDRDFRKRNLLFRVVFERSLRDVLNELFMEL